MSWVFCTFAKDKKQSKHSAQSKWNRTHAHERKFMYIYIFVYVRTAHAHMYRRWSDFDNSPAALLSIYIYACIRVCVRVIESMHVCVWVCVQSCIRRRKCFEWPPMHQWPCLLCTHTHTHAHICIYACMQGYIVHLLYICFFLCGRWQNLTFVCLKEGERERGGNLSTFPHL